MLCFMSALTFLLHFLDQRNLQPTLDTEDQMRVSSTRFVSLFVPTNKLRCYR